MATNALAATNTSALLNEPEPCTRYPMTIGVVIAATFPNVLKRPPLRPAICLGEVSDVASFGHRLLLPFARACVEPTRPECVEVPETLARSQQVWGGISGPAVDSRD